MKTYKIEIVYNRADNTESGSDAYFSTTIEAENREDCLKRAHERFNFYKITIMEIER